MRRDGRVGLVALAGVALALASLFNPISFAQPAAPTLTFSAAASKVAVNKSTTLRWSSTNATACTASGAWNAPITGTKIKSGTNSTGTLTSPRNEFILSCSGPGGSVIRSVIVEAVAVPVLTLSASDTGVNPGESVTLSWSAPIAESCTASGSWSGTKAVSGSETQSNLTKGAKTYTLSCKNVAGTDRESVKVDVLPVPVINFSARPTSVLEGKTTTLRWSATDATACTASGDWSGSYGRSGSFTTPALSDPENIYELRCTGPGGEATATINVKVVSAPTVNLTLDQEVIAPSESVKITWSATDAESCKASGAWSGTKSASGNELISNLTKGNKSFTLTCTGGGGSAKDTAALQVIAKPTLKFDTSAAEVASGKSASLRWSTTDATTCTASGDWSGDKNKSGTFNTGPLTAENNEYDLTCEGPNGEVSASVSVKVLPPPTVTLELSETLVEPGESVTIEWSSEDAKTCRAGGGTWSGDKSLSGTETLTITSPGKKTITLNCIGPGGSKSVTRELGVFKAPDITSFIGDPLLLQVGQKTALSWTSTSAKSCVASGAWTGPRPLNGKNVPSDALTQRTNTFRLTCTGDGGEVSEVVTVEAEGAPRLTFTADATLLKEGDPLRLTWSSEEATSCTASGAWSGDRALSGTVSLANLPVGSQTFTLQCANTIGSESQSVSVEVAIPQAALSATSVAFGDAQVKQAIEREVVLRNPAKLPLVYQGASLTGSDATSFTIDASACGATIAPNAQCVIKLGFRPATGGVKNATLRVATNAGEVLTVALSGRGAFNNLTITKAGTGSGVVTSSPGGINCGAQCAESYNLTSTVILTASASSDSTFTGWSGACTGTSTCTVSMSESKSVTATFALKKVALTVTKSGAGSGTVTSQPSGINCGTSCSGNFDVGTAVILTATPSSASAVGGWTGCGAVTGNACTVSMDRAKSVTVTFAKPAISGKVIDGYIKGARVFVDMNWSMQYEEGEPVAESDDQGSWAFSPSQFEPFQCFKDANGPRPIIASVPTSAVDEDRGAITIPYNLVFLPPSWLGLNLPGSTANLTPFTTLFATAISNAGGGAGLGQTPISVAQACGSEANDIADRVRTQMSRLGEAIVGAGFSTQKLYDDYIASDDLAAQRKGEVLVDYLTRSLQVTQTLVAAVRQEAGVTQRIFSTSGFSTEAITAILGDGIPAALPFDLRASAQGIEIPGGGLGFLHIDVEGIRLRPNGDAIAFNCNETDLGMCPAVPVQSAEQIYKAARNVFKSVSLGDGRGFGFYKGLKSGKVDCENRVRFDYELIKPGDIDPLKITKRELAQLEFIYKMPIENGLARFGCETGDVGLSITKATVYPPTSDGNYYSLFRFGGQPSEGRISQLLPYWSAFARGDFIKTPFDRQRAINELDALPSTPNELPRIEEQLGSTGWYLQTGSKQRDYLLSGSAGKYSCRVTAINSSQAISVTEGAGAVAACYPDLSVFGLPVRLQVSTNETNGGVGKVVSDPAGIDCKTCTSEYAVGTAVTLTAVPGNSNSVLESWGGACTGTGACKVTMSEARSVTATFVSKGFLLSVSKSGTGTGVVASTPAGISCGTDCTENYRSGAVVALTAQPAAGSTFSGWGGACSGSGACSITMDAATTVTARFNGPTSVSGKLVDGYIGGAIVYQDKNDNKQRDAGEPSAASKATGEFSITIGNVDDGPLRTEGGLDIGSNAASPIELVININEDEPVVITPISTLITTAEDVSATVSADVIEQRVAEAFDISLQNSPGQSLTGYDPIEKISSPDTEVVVSARPVYAANIFIVALGHVVGNASSALAKSVADAVKADIEARISARGLQTSTTISVNPDVDWSGFGQEVFLSALARRVTEGVPSDLAEAQPRAAVIRDALSLAGAEVVKQVVQVLDARGVTIAGVQKTYTRLLAEDLGVSDRQAFVSQLEAVRDDRVERLAEFVASAASGDWKDALGTTGSPIDLAKAMTVLSVATDNVEFVQLEPLLTTTGAPAPGKTEASVQSAVIEYLDNVSRESVEVVGDVFGVETRSKYADASVRVLTDGDDTYVGSNSQEIIAGLEGRDVIDGSGGGDKIIGGDDADALSGGDGNDEVYGFRGNDSLFGNSGNDSLFGGTGDDEIDGGPGDDTVLGEDGADRLTGGGGSDTILGAGGDDTISVGGNGGQPFQTTVDGGSGSNSLSISYTAITKLSDFPVRTMDSAGALTLGDASGGVFVIKNIDLRAGKLSVAGRSYDFVDPLPSCNCRGRSNMHDGSLGSTQGVAIHPASGEVVLYLEGSYATFHASRVSNVSYNLQSVPLSIFGTSQKDIVSGGGQGDVILTYGGNDHIYPKGGADSVSSGLGDDVIFVNQASLNEDSLLDGGDGFDILNFGFVYNLDGAGPSISAVTLDMGALGSAINFEGIVGSYFADRITGDSRGNLIIGGGEADLLIGGAGDDIIFGDFDPADGGGDKYGLRQYDVNSSQGNDILRGGEGQDRLDGNDGNDELDGGLGADVLRGGGGVDTFVLRAGDGGSTVAQADTITDFQDGTDVLGLAGGLAFSNLVITQGNGTDTAASNVVIKTSSGEILAVVVGVEVSRISILDFSQISASNPASGIASIPMSPSIGGASSRIGSTIIRAVEQGALQLASATEDTTTGSQYQLRSGIDAVEGQIWQLDYLNSGGSVLSSARLPSTSVVAWRREDRRGVDLPTTAWVRLCGTQLYTLQDGYQLLAGGRSRTLQNGWQSEIVVKGGAEAVLVTGASCSGESLVVSGYAFGVSADEPPLRDEAVPATSFKLKLDPMGRESARKSEARPISVGEICALPRAPELEGFCRAAEAALQ